VGGTEKGECTFLVKNATSCAFTSGPNIAQRCVRVD
jgi:hypothetical protein